MSKTIINITGSKELLGTLFEMEINKIVETIRRESTDDKDKLILQHEASIESLQKENYKLKSKIDDMRRLLTL